MAPLSPAQAKALVRAGLKSLKQTLLVVGVSIVLWQMNATLALLWGIVSSGFFLLRSYGKEWRLTAVTCLLPAACSIGCFVFQAALLPSGRWQAFLGPGLVTGLVLGFVSGRGHKVFIKENQVFARRTLFYLLAWFATTAATQGFALFNLKDLVALGLTGGIFSTAMVTAVSVILYRKYLAEKNLRPPSVSTGRPGPVIPAVLLILALAASARAVDLNYRFNDQAQLYSFVEGFVKAARIPGAPLYWPTSIDYSRHWPAGLQLYTYGWDFHSQDSDYSLKVQFYHFPDNPAPPVPTYEARVPGESSGPFPSLDLGEQSSIQQDYDPPGVLGLNPGGQTYYNMYIRGGRWLLRLEVSMADRGAPSGLDVSMEFAKQVWSQFLAALAGYKAPVEIIPPKRVVLSDPKAVAALVTIILLILSSLGVNISTSLAEALTAELTKAGRSPASKPAAPKPAPPNLTPLFDPESGKDLVIQDGRYKDGKPGQVWYRDQWMDRPAAEAAIAAWEEQYNAERRQWFDARSSEWEKGVQEKIEKENMEIDPYTGAWRKPLDPEERPIVIPPESGDASRDDLDFGLTGVEVSHKTTEARFAELAGIKEKALERLDEARAKYEEALAGGDQWLADKLKERLDRAAGRVDAVDHAAADLQRRVDLRALQKQKFQEGIDNVSAWGVIKELSQLPYQIYESWKNDPGFVETMKDAIAARNKLQDSMDEAPGLYDEHQEALSRLHDIKLQIDEARRNGDKGLEARLRAEAEPLKDDLRRIEDDLNQIHEAKRQWERRASQANLAAYVKATDLVLTGTQTPANAATVNNVIDWYRRRSIPGKTMADSGWTLSDKRSIAEMDLDAEHFQGLRAGSDKVIAWKASANPEEFKKATLDVLEDYQAKRLMKAAPPSIQKEWTAAVDLHRDQPLFRGMAEEANSRGWVTNDKGTLRAVSNEDFGRVTSSKTGAPGQDLDVMYGEIIDAKTKKPVGFRELQDAADKTCARLGFDPAKQEIKVVGGPQGSQHMEAMSIKPGYSADTMYAAGHLRRYDGYDAEQAYRVTKVKGEDSLHLSEADKLSEACRTSVKDYDRVSQNLINTRAGAEAAPPFSEKAIKVMDDVGKGVLPPGTGNRKFRDLAGMDLKDGCEKLNSLQETVVKLDPSPRVSKQEIIDFPGTTNADKVARAEAYADMAVRGDSPRLPDRKLVGAEGWPKELIDNQKWPESMGSVKAGTIKTWAQDQAVWWPEDEVKVPFRSIAPQKWKLDGKFVTEEQRWIMRDKELGLRPMESTPVDIDQILRIRRPPELDALAAANPEFERLDNTVRAAWKEAGGGTDPDSWANLQESLGARGVDERLFEVWYKGATEGKWIPSNNVGSVVAPGVGSRIANRAGDFGTKHG